MDVKMNLSVICRKNKRSQIVTRIVSDFFPECNIIMNNKYINFSIDNNHVGVGRAAVTRMVLGLPDEQFLLSGRSPGSIPGSGAAPTTNNSIEFKGGLIK